MWNKIGSQKRKKKKKVNKKMRWNFRGRGRLIWQALGKAKKDLEASGP
jgi:hypothetical protein